MVRLCFAAVQVQSKSHSSVTHLYLFEVKIIPDEIEVWSNFLCSIGIACTYPFYSQKVSPFFSRCMLFQLDKYFARYLNCCINFFAVLFPQ